MTIWREYHEATKHSVDSLARSTHVLDWATMPDPFRHYEGAPMLDLPADPPSLAVPALNVLLGVPGQTPIRDGSSWLSQLLYYSASISASKRSPSGARYALRVNPSSGNLHPTEFHFVTRGLADWPDGLYHYRPSSHMAEQRAQGVVKLPGLCSKAPVVLILTSIAWREAWKYQARAYRYCLLDIGHAWEAVVLAARAMGSAGLAQGAFADEAVTDALRLAADESPMLLLPLYGAPTDERPPSKLIWSDGEPNRLSPATVEYPAIRQIQTASRMSAPGEMRHRTVARAGLDTGGPPFGEVVRGRRSALNFRGGTESMSRAQLDMLLTATGVELAVDFPQDTRFIHFCLYVHRVRELAPGLYRHYPGQTALELIRPGDQRVMAAGLSLGQELAGNACVAFSMIADLERATQLYGDRGYRYVHFEAGALGQRLYVGAEALSLRATGIGAFYDDEVHRYLGLAPEQGQVVYHFAVGYPVADPRLNA